MHESHSAQCAALGGLIIWQVVHHLKPLRICSSDSGIISGVAPTPIYGIAGDSYPMLSNTSCSMPSACCNERLGMIPGSVHPVNILKKNVEAKKTRVTTGNTQCTCTARYTPHRPKYRPTGMNIEVQAQQSNQKSVVGPATHRPRQETRDFPPSCGQACQTTFARCRCSTSNGCDTPFRLCRSMPVSSIAESAMGLPDPPPEQGVLYLRAPRRRRPMAAKYLTT
mmetsp:Transcript_95908/g.219820  ORF Transcript_95908/g.219820 Transcript_95908/m.219820 type:complete len:224 (+) Transcript_95908:419-1090(+)